MTENRIVFPGNPWPEGHAVEALVWSARLQSGPTLWFDLHLHSAVYYGGDLETWQTSGDDLDEEFDEFGNSDWPAKIVWGNYHRCTISSTKWGHQGFRVGVVEQPLHLAHLTSREFRVDDDPGHLHPDRRASADHDDAAYYQGFAFGGYVLGHTTVAGHRIRFPHQHGRTVFDLEWDGRVASDLGRAHQYTFRATAARIRLQLSTSHPS